MRPAATLTAASLAAAVTLTGCGDSTPPPAAPAPPVATTAAPSPTAAPVLTVTMPNLAGQNAAVAQDTLAKLGFPDNRVQLGSGDPNHKIVLLASNWTVTKQSAKAGAKVTTDTLIVLTCVKK